MFGKIARRYDLTNTVVSAGLDTYWRRCVARRVGGYAAQAILDVACGTGSVLQQLVHYCPPTTQLLGVDLTAAMLQVGRRRLAKAALGRDLHLCAGDAHALPYAEQSCDVVTMVFGVRNFANPHAALAECYRVLRPAGYLCIVEFSWPSRYAWHLLYGMYFRYILPLIAWPLSGERTAYRYLRDSVLAFRQQTCLEVLLRQVGFINVGGEPLSGGITTLYTGRKPLPGPTMEETRYDSRLAHDQPGKGRSSGGCDPDQSAFERVASTDGGGT
jgi:demethylmenaquinone methyltransferase/2-methoxy-6-polyprenyl-1,4-benzoquinol methylase